MPAAVLAAAASSFAAALVHGSVIGVHVREYWLFGVFFAVVAPLQAAWAIMVVRHPDRRGLLVAGLAGNAAVVAIWVVSRTIGLPFGPAPFTPEAVGAKDLLATYEQCAVVVLTALTLRGRLAPSWVIGGAWALAVVGALAAFLPGH